MDARLTILAIACSLPLGLARPAAGQERNAQAAPRTVAVDGASIAYVEEGEGAPVVFLHGAFSDHRVWEQQREPVARKHRFIAIDQRYFGTAPWPDEGERFSPETHVADVAALVRSLKLGPVFLVGRSYGATIALATAVRHPDLVRGLVLNEPQTSAIVADPAEQKVVDEDRRRLADVAAIARTGRVEEATKAFYDWVNDQPGGFDALPDARRKVHLDNARTVPFQLGGPPLAVTCEQAGQLKVPVLITRGARTRRYFSVIAAAAQRCIPAATLLTIEGARHGAPSQQAARFNEALLAFLERNAR